MAVHYVRPGPHWAIIQVDPEPRRILPLDHQPHTLRRGGVGGWRSRQVARGQDVIEFGSTPGHEMTLQLLFDAVNRPFVDDVEDRLALLHLFGRKVNPDDPHSQPPSLALTFGIGQQLRWVINDSTPEYEIRSPVTGRRVQSMVVVELVQATFAQLAFTDTTPVETVPHYVRGPDTPVGGTAGTRTHTVQPGDTLIGIASALLGDPGRFEEIYQLNSPPLTDRNLIPVGLELTLP